MARPPSCVHYLGEQGLPNDRFRGFCWRLLGGFRMRRNQLFLLPAFLLLTLSAALAAQPGKEPTLIAKPDAFKTLLHPNCSHCLVEANRRKEELRADDRVLCWMQVQ